jgi:aryl-alcohol dehydrogenase-like predicted oxidoreductase
MQHMLFGKSGLRVSELCLGTMTFGDDRAMGSSELDSKAIFDTFADAGGTFIDTADHYAEGESERIIGKLISADRDNFILATKWSASRTLGLLQSGNSRRNMARAVEASLSRLGTDRIDLYFLHLWDFMTPWEEVLRGMDDLVRAGKVQYLAISDTPAWEISRAQMMAELRGWSSFAGIQIEYSLAARTADRELLPMADTLELGVCAWSPLAGGILSGKYARRASNQQARRDAASIDQRVLKIADEVLAIAGEMGIAAAHVAIAWVRQRGRLAPLIPIVGARTPEQIKDNLSGLDVVLDEAAIARLETVSAVEYGFPHDLLRTDYVRSILLGGDTRKLRLRSPLPYPVEALPMSSGVSKG